jgi:hypothetical protein
VELHRSSRAQEQREKVYRSVVEAINSGDADALNQWISPDIVDHNPIPYQAPGLVVRLAEGKIIE